ncbi:MAG: hypothetical protein N4A71_07590 [Carboxylicivirga sp.]|nr:hypothetical protein [Carboxylicivirga sp.]
MSRFLLYLFESGLCLSLFYMGYIVFFRKETYFTFNRIYLLASLILALVLPLTSIDISGSSAEYINQTAQKISSFRNYYEDLILMTEPDFKVSDELNTAVPVQTNMGTETQVKQSFSSISWSALFFFIYLSGVLFFTIRLLILFFNLFSVIRRNQVLKKDAMSIVLIEDEIPSFSFLRWIFINRSALKDKEYEQVIAHEKVHVQHKHTVDLLLAHIITIFQWFNPLTWRIQKSIKTCHEYIADRQVIDQGHELFDYQSLLLSQLVSIRSVELVNNFNLLSIKKRIAMMNKIKSGSRAKLKALLVIPMLTFAFFFFSNMTGKTLSVEKNIEIIESQQAPELIVPSSTIATDDLEVDATDESSIPEMEETTAVVDFLKPEPFEYIVGRYEIKLLNEESSKTSVMDDLPSVNLPTAKSVKTFDYDFVLYSILYSKDGFYIDGKREDLSKAKLILDKKQKSQTESFEKKAILLEIDKSMKMKEVDNIKHALRENNLLKIAYVAKPDESAGIESSKAALLNLLPPKNAKRMDADELKKKNIKLFTIKNSSRASLNELGKQLRKHVMGNKKYVIMYEYSNNTSYEDFLHTVDMVYSNIWSIRKEHAFFEGMNYKNLTKDEEKALRKKYPITLTTKNVDME